MKPRLALALLLVLLLPSPLGAQPPQDRLRAQLKAGEERYQDQDYRAAIEVLSTVVQDPVATRAERARAYEYLGMAQLILGHKTRAREAFEELLAIDAHYTLTDPSHSPKLREFFEGVRASFLPGYGRAQGEAELEHAAPTAATAGRPIEVQADVIRGAQLVRDVALEWRRQGLLTYASEAMSGGGGRWRLSFAPPRDNNDYALEYYLEARDEHGRVVARVASAEAPLLLPVRGAPLPPTAWYKRWYVWAAVGAVVAGAAIGGIVAGTAERAPVGTLPPGRVSLGLTISLGRAY
jgi:hypothetical protein